MDDQQKRGLRFEISASSASTSDVLGLTAFIFCHAALPIKTWSRASHPAQTGHSWWV